MDLKKGVVPYVISYAKDKGVLRNQLAYILATIYHETGTKMLPVRENMNYSADRIVQVFGKKHSAKVTPAEAQKLAYKPEALAERVYGLGNPSMAKRLGNTAKGDGWKYRGGGVDQRTGKANYIRVGIYDPETVLQLDVAAKLIVDDMMSGGYTGKKLGDYITLKKSDWVGARWVVNSQDQAHKIAGYAASYDKDLLATGYGIDTVVTVKPDDILPEPEKPLSASKRLWMWLSTGGIFVAMDKVPENVQIALVAAGVAIVTISIITMPQVRNKIGGWIETLWQKPSTE